MSGEYATETMDLFDKGTSKSSKQDENKIVIGLVKEQSGYQLIYR